MLSRPSPPGAATALLAGLIAALLVGAGCGAVGGSASRAPRIRLGTRDLVLETTPTAVCLVSIADPPPCVPLVRSTEAVVSASLTRLDASADVVMVLAGRDVAVDGLGAGTADVPVRVDGRNLRVWLRAVRLGTTEVCASYLGPDGKGRVIVHRTLAVGATGILTVAPEAGDGC